MSKTKTTFHCQECGAEYAKWQGQCNKCGSWNSIIEEIKQVSTENLWDHTKSELNKTSNKPTSIDEITIQNEFRIKTQDNEFNRVLGGGIVPGSITLLGGEPGIGKSTLFLQISLKIIDKVLYVSGAVSYTHLTLPTKRIV